MHVGKEGKWIYLLSVGKIKNSIKKKLTNTPICTFIIDNDVNGRDM